MKLRLTNFGRYLPVFMKTGFSAACRYFFPNEKKIPDLIDLAGLSCELARS
jgi:hypothetical protein